METDMQSGSTVAGTYVYCVIPSTMIAEKESPTFGVPIDPSTTTRIVRENGLAALVSDALRAHYDPSRLNIGAHERIVREAHALGDVLPMRFGTVARDDRAVESFLRDKHEDLERSLQQLNGRAELALKVLWDRDSILKEILVEDEAIRALRE